MKQKTRDTPIRTPHLPPAGLGDGGPRFIGAGCRNGTAHFSGRPHLRVAGKLRWDQGALRPSRIFRFRTPAHLVCQNLVGTIHFFHQMS